MSTTSNTSGGGIGVAGILGIIFVCAKVFGVAPIASWSWWWVLCPFWIGMAIVLCLWAFIGLGAAVVAAIVAILNSIGKRRR